MKLPNLNFSLRSNILSSFAGNGLVAIIYFVSVPFFLRYLGVEAYGLVGVFISFQAVLGVLDLGLAVTLTRELAVRSADPQRAGDVRHLVRTAEAAQWAVALVVGALTFSFSSQLAKYANPQGLGESVVAECFAIMSIALALQFPIGLYSGGLFGAQRLVLYNAVNLFFSVFRNLGGIAVLHFISAEPRSFFAWQAVSSVFQAATMAVCLWSSLPAGTQKAEFRFGLLKEVWRFSLDLTVISVASLLITQIDKLVLVRLLPLELFGYYAIAGVVSGGVYRLIQPIFQSYLPRLSQIVGVGDGGTLARTYHQGCQLIAVAVLPFSCICVLFSWEILVLWQRDVEIADNSYVLMSLLAAGGGLNALLLVPYALQLAHGWTRLNLVALPLTVCLSVPAIIVLTSYFAAAGAASVWIILNAVLIVVLIPIMHRKILTEEKWKWYGDDVLKPLISVIATGALCRYLFVRDSGQALMLIQLAVAFLAVSAAAVLSTPYIRQHMQKWLT